MFCPNCGNKLNENEDFCPKCGNRVTKLDNIPNDSSSTQQNLPTNTSNEQTMSEKLSKNS